MSDQLAEGVFARGAFLPPVDLVRVLAAIDRLAGSWAPSEALGLLGRGGTSQVRSGDIAVQGPLDEIRQILAPAVLRWARACGFWFARPPRLQLFPVRMIGDRAAPPHQEPHVDSWGVQAGAPICTNVFYATAKGLDGGELVAARVGEGGETKPVLVRPATNTIVTLSGDRVHWVQPLYAGERVSVVVNFY
jgi:hypothetical protein